MIEYSKIIEIVSHRIDHKGTELWAWEILVRFMSAVDLDDAQWIDRKHWWPSAYFIGSFPITKESQRIHLCHFLVAKQIFGLEVDSNDLNVEQEYL